MFKYEVVIWGIHPDGSEETVTQIFDKSPLGPNRNFKLDELIEDWAYNYYDKGSHKVLSCIQV